MSVSLEAPRQSRLADTRGPMASPLAALLRNRPATALLGGVSALHLGLAAWGLPGWPCPLLHGLGVPCPGCGLSRATLELLRGDWQAALAHHAFAPVLVLAVGVIGGTALLPQSLRLALIDAIESLERRSGLTALVLVALVLYWIARLFFVREALPWPSGRRP